MNVQPIMAIARYEVLMAWRRRSLGIVWLLIVATIVVFTLITRVLNDQVFNETPQGIDTTVTTTADSQTVISDVQLIDLMRGLDPVQFTRDAQVATTLYAVTIVGVIGVLMFFNEFIPLDRQHKTHELLVTLPIGRATYLAGKLAGVWVTILLIAPTAAVVGYGVMIVLEGPFDGTYYTLMWAVFLLPTLLMTSALTVLLTSPAANRRVAVLMGLLLTVPMLLLFSIALTSLGQVGVYMHDAYAIFMLMSPGPAARLAADESIRNAIPQFLIVIIAAWVFAYGWQRWQAIR